MAITDDNLNSLNKSVNEYIDTQTAKLSNYKMADDAPPITPPADQSSYTQTTTSNALASYQNNRDAQQEQSQDLTPQQEFPYAQTQAETIDPNREYGNLATDVSNQAESAVMHGTNMVHELGVKAGVVKPWSDHTIAQRQAEFSFFQDQNSKTPEWQKLAGLGASLVLQPEMVGAGLAAKSAMYGVNLSANLLRIGRVPFLSSAAKIVSFRPISYGIDGLAGSAGWTGSDKLDADAMNEKFDNSQYLTNAMIFGMMGVGIGAAIHPKIGAALGHATQIAKQAFAHGISPKISSFFVKGGIEDAKKDIGDEIMTGKGGLNKEVGAPETTTNWGKLSESITDNLDKHNVARKELGYNITEEPTTSLNMDVPATLTDVTDAGVREKLGITSNKYKGVEFESPVDAAVYRATTTESKSVSLKLFKKIKALTGDDIPKIKEHAKLLTESVKATDGTVKTLYTPHVDQTAPYVDMSKSQRMAMRGETPYSTTYKTIDKVQEDQGNAMRDLMDKESSGTIKPKENARLQDLTTRLQNTAAYQDTLKDKENKVMANINSDIHDSVGRLNASAVRHLVLHNQNNLAEEAMESLGQRGVDISPTQVRQLFDLPEDASHALRTEAHAGEGADQGELESHMMDEYNQLKSQVKSFKSKELADELSNIVNNEKDHENYQPWLDKVAGCLMRNEV